MEPLSASDSEYVAADEEKVASNAAGVAPVGSVAVLTSKRPAVPPNNVGVIFDPRLSSAPEPAYTTTLQWDPVQDATGYRVQWALPPLTAGWLGYSWNHVCVDNASDALPADIHLGSSAIISGLTPNKAYVFRVQPVSIVPHSASTAAAPASLQILEGPWSAASAHFTTPTEAQELSFAQLQLSEAAAALKRACALTEAAEAAMQASAARASTAEASASAAIAQLSQSTVARMEETGELRNALQAQSLRHAAEVEALQAIIRSLQSRQGRVAASQTSDAPTTSIATAGPAFVHSVDEQPSRHHPQGDTSASASVDEPEEAVGAGGGGVLGSLVGWFVGRSPSQTPKTELR